MSEEKKRQKNKIKKIVKYFILLIIIIVIILIAINICITVTTKKYIYSEMQNIPQAQTALILGAGISNDGRLSDILKDRLDTAIELYELGKVNKILLSGDHGRKEYDETNAMKKYMLKNNIQEKDIFLDHAGFDTYDSVYRAKYIFEVDSLIIVTQKFHLPRAIYIAKNFNVATYGIIADKHIYLASTQLFLREKLAQIKAFSEVTLNAKPKYLGEKIPITGDSKKSWD